jgi:hypothetical protein
MTVEGQRAAIHKVFSVGAGAGQGRRVLIGGAACPRPAAAWEPAAAAPGLCASCQPPPHLVCDVEGDVEEGGAVGVPRHLQPLDRRQAAVRVAPQLRGARRTASCVGLEYT